MKSTRFNISDALRGSVEEVARKSIELVDNIPYGVSDSREVLAKIVAQLPDDAEDYRDTLLTIASFCVTMVAMEDLKEANTHIAKGNTNNA